MAKTSTTPEASTDQVQGSTAAEPETKKVVIPETGPAQMTLGQMVGSIVGGVIDDGDGKRMPFFKNQMTIWYNAQPTEDRKAQVLEAKKRIELARSVIESVYAHHREISMVDTNA